MGRKNVPAALTGAFVLAESAVYFLFLTLDLYGFGALSARVKYAGILLCLCFCILCCLFGSAPLLPCALLLTAWADLLLLLKNSHYIWGVALFLAVQLLYLLLLCRRGAGLGLWLRLALALLAGLAVWLSGLFSPLNLLAGLYFSQLLANTILAWRRLNQAGLCLALGLTLFVGCDLCVGLFNLAAYIPAALYSFAAFAMWMFYLPSQVLISLSALSGKEVFHT